jgi:hypothetical protein
MKAEYQGKQRQRDDKHSRGTVEYYATLDQYFVGSLLQAAEMT